jgi:hypothetical protein
MRQSSVYSVDSEPLPPSIIDTCARPIRSTQLNDFHDESMGSQG